MNYILIIAYFFLALYGISIGKFTNHDFIITFGICILCFILEDWRRDESKSTFR